MSNIIPFESAALPAHLQGMGAPVDDLFAGSGVSFPVMSIKGKVFSIKRSGDKTIITRPDDPDTPAANLDLVILRTQSGVSKTYYAKGYSEGADESPDCTSSDGIAPDASATNKQAEKCAVCKHNQWGSKVSPDGKELKACQDNKRMAVASPTQLNDPMLLRVPPASFKALNEYAKLLKTRGVTYNALVTKIGFVMDVATPQLTFKPVGFLSAEGFTEAQAQFHSDVVQQIVGLLPAEEGSAEEFSKPDPAATKEAPPPADDAAVKAAAEEAAKAKAAKAKAAKAKAAAEEAAKAKAEAEAAAAKAQAEAEASPEVVELDEVEASLEAALADLNFDFDD